MTLISQKFEDLLFSLNERKNQNEISEEPALTDHISSDETVDTCDYGTLSLTSVEFCLGAVSSFPAKWHTKVDGDCVGVRGHFQFIFKMHAETRSASPPKKMRKEPPLYVHQAMH